MTPNFCSGCGGVWGIGCGCQVPSCNYTVINETNPVSGITNGVNANIAGIGVLDALNAGTLYFRGLESANGAFFTFTLNATNHTIVATFDVNALAAALPQATTTQAGVGETATDAEAQGKASTTVFLTPSNLAALGASDTFAGLTEYATDAEAIAGVSTTLALTPANLTAVLVANPSTQTFANAVTRAGAIPDYVGQIGYQLDSGQGYIGFGLAAGNWHALITDGLSNDINGLGIFNGIVSFSAPGGLDFSGGLVSIGGIDIPANSVVITGGLAGSLSSSLISTFISSANTQTGYTAFTNPATIRTCDTGTVTLQQLAQLVGTLIEDFKALKLPAT
jgi:hypothetical protein